MQDRAAAAHSVVAVRLGLQVQADREQRARAAVDLAVAPRQSSAKVLASSYGEGWLFQAFLTAEKSQVTRS